ncbi:MAG: hypothetical protein HPY50_03920 [Firmicutes bacterium]|nr:hypothetical protein [Bacillota bacterium]
MLTEKIFFGYIKAPSGHISLVDPKLLDTFTFNEEHMLVKEDGEIKGIYVGSVDQNENSPGMTIFVGPSNMNYEVWGYLTRINELFAVVSKIEIKLFSPAQCRKFAKVLEEHKFGNRHSLENNEFENVATDLNEQGGSLDGK